MKTRLMSYGVAATAMLGVLCLLLVSVPAAQNRAENGETEAKATPRLPNGHPDFSGYYRGGIAGVSNAQPDEQPVVRTEDGSVFFAYGGALAGVEAAEDGNTVEDRAANQRNPAPY